ETVMTRTPDPTGPLAPPSLADFFTQYLRRQAAAQAEGLGYPEPGDEVVPHEAVPVQPVDPQLAWHDALAVVSHFHPPVAAPACRVPPQWPALVTAQEPAIALAFCLANFPQLVRNLHPLLSAEPIALRVTPTRPADDAGLPDWARQARDYPQVLLAAGVLRL